MQLCHVQGFICVNVAEACKKSLIKEQRLEFTMMIS